VSWGIVCSVEPDAILILDLFAKKTRTTPKTVIDACRRRLRSYEAATRDEG
jgi:phage-related protein